MQLSNVYAVSLLAACTVKFVETVPFYGEDPKTWQCFFFVLVTLSHRQQMQRE